MSESPFPPWEVAAPWLGGHAAGLATVLGVAAVVVVLSTGPARGRRVGALGWGFACTLMPVAWLVARWMPEWTGAVGIQATGTGAAVAALVHGLAAWAAVYLSDVGSTATPSRRKPRAPTAAPSKPAVTAPASPEAPAPLAVSPAPTARKRLKPTLAPPTGATAASGSGQAPEADGLLRVLAEGTGMQRSAAARALALSFEGTASKAVADGLLSVLADEEADDESRVEAWVAVCKVMGDPLPWALESALRDDGPSSIDPAQVLAWQDRLNDPE